MTSGAATARDRVLDAALKVMTELGMARTTTKEIARAADLSEAMIYRSFTDKADLFLAVLKERLPQVGGQGVEALIGASTVRANLAQIAARVADFYQASFPIAVSIFSDTELLDRHRNALAARGTGPQHLNASIAGYLRAEQRLGRLPEAVNAEVVSAMIAGACFQRAFFIHFAGSADPEDAHRFAKELVHCLDLD